ncbi:MAG: flavin reductase family protein, partial [Nitrospinaceae bacterium]|nr:flavin reductase family protein [Nitrospinaceae bacterium]
MKFVTVDPSELDRRQIYRFMVGSIVPRPIAWVSTISGEGHTNLAPFSFFTAVSHAPPMMSISVGETSEAQKHTTRNILETQGYVIHVVVNGMEEEMNICSGNFPEEVSELSRRVEARYGFMVHRDADYLTWRFQRGRSRLHRSFGIYDREGAFKGYVVVQLPRDGELHGFIV